MNNKGFTLVELLAVLVILSILITIAVPSVNRIMLSINENMYCEKVSNLESAAKMYAEDNYMDKISINEKVIVESVTLGTLVDKSYVKKDNEICSIGDVNNPCLVDPRDNSSMDNLTFRIYTKNNRIYASVNFDKSVCD